ncbi:MAG: hypothetical protein L6N94_04735, partial [Candidatus Methylarchaceae archaeon HK01M]|nr:hypothetical protein [Candidatus Methylarchaceae archaeon HK01M]
MRCDSTGFQPSQTADKLGWTDLGHDDTYMLVNTHVILSKNERGHAESRSLGCGNNRYIQYHSEFLSRTKSLVKWSVIYYKRSESNEWMLYRILLLYNFVRAR